MGTVVAGVKSIGSSLLPSSSFYPAKQRFNCGSNLSESIVNRLSHFTMLSRRSQTREKAWQSESIYSSKGGNRGGKCLPTRPMRHFLLWQNNCFPRLLEGEKVASPESETSREHGQWRDAEHCSRVAPIFAEDQRRKNYSSGHNKKSVYNGARLRLW